MLLEPEENRLSIEYLLSHISSVEVCQRVLWIRNIDRNEVGALSGFIEKLSPAASFNQSAIRAPALQRKFETRPFKGRGPRPLTRVASSFEIYNGLAHLGHVGCAPLQVVTRVPVSLHRAP